MKLFLLVGAGGFLGSALRYQLSVLIGKTQWIASSLPPTLVVNVVGCLLIGLLMGYSQKLSKELLLFLTTGFCGGFTTFSTFSLESLQFIQRGSYKMAALYICLSLMIGVVFTLLGLWLSRQSM